MKEYFLIYAALTFIANLLMIRGINAKEKPICDSEVIAITCVWACSPITFPPLLLMYIKERLPLIKILKAVFNG